jgi:hypothetical protein
MNRIRTITALTLLSLVSWPIIQAADDTPIVMMDEQATIAFNLFSDQLKQVNKLDDIEQIVSAITKLTTDLEAPEQYRSHKASTIHKLCTLLDTIQEVKNTDDTQLTQAFLNDWATYEHEVILMSLKLAYLINYQE